MTTISLKIKEIMVKIILSTVVALFLLGCNDTTTHETHKQEVKQKAEVVEQKVAPVQVQEVKKEVKEVKPVVEEHSLKKVVEVAPVKTEVVQKKIAVVKQETSTVDAAKLFMACAACHGSHAEKSALNKSQVIQGWSVTKIEKALQGYKDGSYGGAMKGIMKGQASKLNDAEIKALAEYISKL